ncbi:uncharacterized protein LOC129216537 [Uloborus diversus]|uniref:uncharacterized protein LOC129216537 n=1 Tax=Uloborus diversus TaxID=327109 RepID=UPI00240A42CC|nr:uncharacterized protein LOC129216537 [Uloborus diversus]
MAEAVVEEYRSSLSELSFNSKPHINMLTMLAEDNVQHADQIVETIVAHINAVPPQMKLPGMYLVDSVIKNIGGHYIPLFGSHMTTLFTSVFEKESQTGIQTAEDQTTDEREKSDMKRTQLEVIKELEEKKEKLRKYELALREKIDKPKSINVVAPTVVQPIFVNTRDPRLKKALATSGQVVPLVKSFASHQPSSNSLQSVIVVPNARTSNINGVKTEDVASVFHQPHPLRIGFNGHSAEFELGGRIHTVQFGVPGREIFVNSVPFEASFGGPSFVALLGDGQLHSIQIDGPPPRVLTSQIPAYELYEKFRSLHSDIRLPQIEKNSSSEKIDGLCDIDMRFKISNITKPRLDFDHAPDAIKDIDWRQISHPETTQSVFDLPKPYHASYQSVEPELRTSDNRLEVYDRQSSPEFDGKLLCPSETKAPLPLKPPPLGPFLNPALISNSMQKTSEPPYSVPPTTVLSSVSSNSVMFSHTSVPNVSAIDAALSSLNSIAKSLPQVQIPTLTSITARPSIQSTLMPKFKNEEIFPGVSTHSQVTVPQQIQNQQWQPLLPPPPFPGSLPGSERLEHNPHQAVSLSVSSIQPPLLPNPTTTISSSVPPSTESTISSVSPAPKMNVELFLEKLIAAGIIGKKKDEPIAAVTSDLNSSENSPEEVKDADEEVIPVIELVPKSLREYHPVVINLLYKGSQCATCGMRFKEIQSEHYSRHLDWHFRTNRREKDGAKKPLSRRLFYEVKDWVDFKEFEDFEERAPSYFELQASGEQTKEVERENILSVPSIRCETEICSVCGEQFQLFWVEEEEEWHLKYAVRHNDQVYHPACYEDFCKASEKPSSSENELDDSIVVVEEPEDKVDVKSDSATEVKIDMESNSASETKMDVELNSAAEVKMEVESNSAADNQDSATVADSVVDESDTVDSKEAVDSATSETVITLKTEPVDLESVEQSSVKEETSLSIVISEPSDTSTATPVETETSNNDESTKEEKSSEALSESSQTDTKVAVKEESDDEMEFRPPTPDPNFENLPPVFKGTELSALCCIM